MTGSAAGAPLPGGQEPDRGAIGYISAMQGEDVQERRERLRRLDDCLNLLEVAHEHDLTVVTEKIAEMIQDRVPSIHAGMLIADAIEEVLREQEPYMVQVRPEQSNRRVRRRREPFDIRVLLSRR